MGGQGQKTAFWVVYLSKEEILKATKHNLHHMNENTHYNSLIAKPLQVEV
jgi:hypothetical protein